MKSPICISSKYYPLYVSPLIMPSKKCESRPCCLSCPRRTPSKPKRKATSSRLSITLKLMTGDCPWSICCCGGGGCWCWNIILGSWRGWNCCGGGGGWPKFPPPPRGAAAAIMAAACVGVLPLLDDNDTVFRFKFALYYASL